MNCTQRAPSLPSGGKNTISANSSRIGKNVTSTERERPVIRNPRAVMRKADLENIRNNSLQCRSCQDFANYAGRLHTGELLLQPLERILKFVIIETQHV